MWGIYFCPLLDQSSAEMQAARKQFSGLALFLIISPAIVINAHNIRHSPPPKYRKGRQTQNLEFHNNAQHPLLARAILESLLTMSSAN